LSSLPQPVLHPDELAVYQCGALECRVNKMNKVMGAPIDDADAKAIAEYLAKNYGS